MQASKSKTPAKRPSVPSSTMDFDLLRRYGIPVLPACKVDGVEAALSCAKRLGYPVALKLISSQFLHKTDSGALALNIGNEHYLRVEYGRLMKMAGGDKAASILVQAYRPGRFELIVGGRTDPQFGPIVLLGTGGIYTEVLRDMAIRVCPLDEREARSMIRSLKSHPILAGARGRKPVDEAALVRILLQVSKLMEKEKPAELDLNPVLVRDDGLWAADVRVIK
ncbi:Acetate--CoA ligase [ADP-forming] I subunit beta [uncultured archaeon]|nr:Acetate--CoA ligase [ADP-forming] I subunit beta [uncultured archaeon]